MINEGESIEGGTGPDTKTEEKLISYDDSGVMPKECGRRAHLSQGHVPYKAWCRVCVAPEARDNPHRRLPKDKKPAVPLIALDYFYLGTMVEHKSEKLPILVGYVQALGAGFAHVARIKGAGHDTPIQSLVKWMTSMGLNGDLCLRTDPEPSIKNVGQVVAQR